MPRTDHRHPRREGTPVRELHVVAVSDDGELVLGSGPEARGGYRLPVDEQLRRAIKGEVSSAGREGSGLSSALTPREIQARLRAGDTPDDVVRAAGVPMARNERLVAPTLAERALVVEQAQQATMSRARRGASALPLGESVTANLVRTAGLRPETIVWTAWREDTGAWIVAVSYVARSRLRTGRWAWDPRSHSVLSLDSQA